MLKNNRIIQTELDKAADLIEENAREEAKAILEKLLRENPSREEIYKAAVDLYWWAEMYPEIRGLFKRYKENRGEELKANVSLVDIEKREKKLLEKKKAYDAQDVKVFKRIPWWLYFIRSIETSKQGISFKTINFKTYFYKWPEVQEAVLRKIIGSDEISALTGPSPRSLTIRTADGKSYKVSIGTSEQSQNLLSEIRNYVKVKRGTTKKEGFLKAIIGAVILFSIMIIGSAAGWEGEIIGFICLFFIILYYFIHRRF